MPRMSVAVRPPPEVIAVLAAFERPALPGVRWSIPAQWLVKLRPLGYVDEDLADPLTEALEAELDGATPVRCTLGPSTRRMSDWLWAPVAGLDELAAAVMDATVGLVPVTHPQPFRAFLTLATGRVPKELGGLPIAAAWTATEVALVADRSAPRWVRHDDLAVIELGDPPPEPGRRATMGG
jgi:2'-5' RNA ligase